jgi:peptidyl-prolyl cis-trans isomerase C
MITPRLLREPLVHFLLLGGAIVAVLHFQQRAQQRHEIRIDAGVQRQLVVGYTQQFGAAPDAATLRRLIDQRVREEIMVREALALGLDRDDEIIRRRLQQKYEFLQQDLAAIAEPTEQQLQDFYLQHRAAYVLPMRVSFTHIYFAPEAGDEAAQRRARRVLQLLAARPGTARAPELGDRFPELYDYASLSAVELERLFGPSPLAVALPLAPERQWSGPYRSGFGWHLVYVTGREAARQPPLAEVRKRVQSDFLGEARERANAATFAQIAARYHVIVGDAP